MKKILGALLLSALAFTGCLDNKNDAYEKMQRVAPGVAIYNYSRQQNGIAMQPANAGVRLAVLLAEAEKQERSDLTKVVDEKGNSVMQALFTKSVKIEGNAEDNALAEGDYRITFNSGEQMYDGFYLKGSLIVHTGGVQLVETTPQAPWRVTPEESFQAILVSTGSFGREEQVIDFTEGNTSICSNGDGSYVISLGAIRTNIHKVERYSDWGGTCRFRPEANSIAYSECKDKNFTVTMEFGGATIYAFASTVTTTGTRMTYKLSDGKYMFGAKAFTGTVVATLPSTGDYDASYYVSPEVRITWTYNQSGNSFSGIVEYDGYTESLYF